jgi:F0F1-type ATP synthase alpha subunit
MAHTVGKLRLELAMFQEAKKFAGTDEVTAITQLSMDRGDRLVQLFK